MAINWEAVEDMDASLATVPGRAQQAILLDVYAQLSASRWGTSLDLGAKYLAAHYAALGLRGGTGGVGPVVSESLGDASHTFATPQMNASDGDLGSTLWGQMFLRLRRSILGPLWVQL